MDAEKFEELCAGRSPTAENMPEILRAWRIANAGFVNISIVATTKAIQETSHLISQLYASFSSPITELKDGRHDYFVVVTPAGGNEDNLEALAEILRRPGIEIKRATKYTTEGNVIDLTL